MDSIRTVLNARPRDYHYEITEYFPNGGFKTMVIKSTDTHMRIENDGQQFEIRGYTGWELCVAKEFGERFGEWLLERKAKGFTGIYPKPPYLK